MTTQFGISESIYDGATLPHLHGVGQGNGTAPTIWAAVSSPLLQIQHNEGHGALFQAPLSNEKIKVAGFAFVDDTDLCQTTEAGAPPGTILTQLQASLDCWHGSLTAMGGALVPAKSFWVLSAFQWKEGIWHYTSALHTPGQIQMTSPEGTRCILERIEPHEGWQTLGIRLAADGSNLTELTYLRKTSEEWAEHIRNRHLPRHLAWRALTTILWPKLTCPLAATTFAPHECRYITAPALKAGLAASGIVGTFPRVLTHCSREAFGLGVWDLFTAQGWAHLQICLLHGPSTSSITGRLLWCSIETMKLELGLPGPLFSHDFDLFSPLQRILGLRQYGDSCG